MPSSPTLLLVLDLAGTFVFALDGGLTALRATRLDIVGVVTLAMITALGGGILRDLVIGAIPPATFDDWRYLTVAAAGGLIAFVLAGLPDRLNLPINLLDAAGLSLFAVTGASKALDFGLGPGQAIILGAVTAVGGGSEVFSATKMGSGTNISQQQIVAKELTLVGSRLNRRFIPQVVQWFAEGKLQPRGMITQTIPAADARAAFDLIENEPQRTIKVHLDFAE